MLLSSSNTLSSRLLSKNLRIKIYKTMILSVVLYRTKHGLLRKRAAFFFRTSAISPPTASYGQWKRHFYRYTGYCLEAYFSRTSSLVIFLAIFLRYFPASYIEALLIFQVSTSLIMLIKFNFIKINNLHFFPFIDHTQSMIRNVIYMGSWRLK